MAESLSLQKEENSQTLNVEAENRASIQQWLPPRNDTTNKHHLYAPLNSPSGAPHGRSNTLSNSLSRLTYNSQPGPVQSPHTLPYQAPHTAPHHRAQTYNHRSQPYAQTLVNPYPQPEFVLQNQPDSRNHPSNVHPNARGMRGSPHRQPHMRNTASCQQPLSYASQVENSISTFRSTHARQPEIPKPAHTFIGFGPAMNGQSAIGYTARTSSFKGNRRPISEVLEGDAALQFWIPGKVFAITDAEPAGVGALRSLGASDSSSNLSTGSQGNPVFSKYRLFVVVRVYEKYCMCLPISSYGVQGLASQKFTDIERQAHMVIYTTNTTRDTEDDKYTSHPPIAVIPFSKTKHTLGNKSRLDSRRLKYVERNLPVDEWGNVVADDFKLLLKIVKDAVADW